MTVPTWLTSALAAGAVFAISAWLSLVILAALLTPHRQRRALRRRRPTKPCRCWWLRRRRRDIVRFAILIGLEPQCAPMLRARALRERTGPLDSDDQDGYKPLP